jgi:hypothetical protein
MTKKVHFFSLSLAALLLAPSTLKAQDDITNIFKAGVNDLQTIAEGYIKPLGYGFSAGLGNNWYNTAATHKLLGFDITVGASGVFTPSSDQKFNLTGLKSLTAVHGETTAPTFGSKGDGVALVMKDKDGNQLTKFNTPDGVYNITPVPSLQLTIGLPLGNDLSVRFVPTINTNNFNVSLWGIGLKHNIKQWIPGVKHLPFDAAVMIGYTKFKLDYTFDDPITPSDLNSSGPDENSATYDNQGMKLRASAFSANVIISKKLAFFTPYIGLGIIRSSFDFNFTGNFPILDYNSTTNATTVKTLTDPIPLHYALTQPGLTAGFRLKMLWVLAFHAQYTLQKYSTASIGFGLNIR